MLRAKKKGANQKNDNNNPLTFLFYNYSAEKLDLLKQSVSRISKDLKNAARFCIIGNNMDTDPGPEETGLEILDRSNSFLPELQEGQEAIVLIPMDRIEKAIHFNDLLRNNELAIPGPDDYSAILFKNNPPYGSGSYIIGRELYKSLSSVAINKFTDFEANLLWYLERMRCTAGKTVYDQPFPFSKPSPFYKKIKFSSAPLARWFDWNTGAVFRKNKSLQSPLAGKRLLFAGISLLIFILLPLFSLKVGISGDEEKHHLHAEKVYNYFQTDGADTLALNDPKYKLNFYSQSFDLFAYVIAEKLNIEKVYELRHFLNGIFGALAIIIAGLLTRFIAGHFAAILSLIFLALSPRFLGHAMNNPLDIPFAFGYIFTIYHIFRFLRRLPSFSLRHSFWIFFGIAFTTSIRIGGMVLIPYFFMFAGLYLLFTKWPWKIFTKDWFSFAKKGILYLLIISIAGYFISLLPWPYALQNPIKNPFKALDMMENISVALRVMFEGKIIWSDILPWYYIPKNMIISIPLIILFSFFIPAFMLFKKELRQKGFWILMLYFSVIFPIAYIIYKDSNVYGGWRHLLFVYPALVVLAATGLSWLRSGLPKKSLRLALTGIILLAFIQPALHIVRNFPLHYIYFNQLTGGVNKAYKKYETDYYLHSLKPGTDWILDNLKPETKGEKLKIISNAPYDIMKYYYRNDSDWISPPYTRYYDRGSYDWDYAIFYCNYIDPYQLKKGIWPPKNTIHEIKVDDVVVCAIVERKNKDDFNGIQMLQTGARERNMQMISEGLEKLENAVKYDPNNEIALLSLARGYNSIRYFKHARKSISSLLEVYPNYDKALDALGFSYLSEGELSKNKVLVDQSIGIFNKILGINHKYVPAYHNLGVAYMLKGDDNRALSYFDQALNLNARYKQSYYAIANIYERQGNKEKARQIIEYANSF